MESYGDAQLERPFREASLQVDFEGETGHGNGPTQEFYTLICRYAALHKIYAHDP